MIIRTISQLPKIDSMLPDDSLIEVSVSRVSNTGTNYISKACRFGTLHEQLRDEIQNSVINMFNMKDSNNQVIDIAQQKSRIDTIMSNAVTFTGSNANGGRANKIFGVTAPVLMQASENNDADPVLTDTVKNYAATKGYVHTIVDSITRINSTASFKPVQFLFDDNTTKNIAYLDNGNSDGKKNNVPTSGTLVAYGWLADTGVIDTAQCWVALEGLINGIWKPLMIQPWILGTRHEYLQYVGFTLPVAAGMELRIRTGFDLNYSNSSYQLRNGTLLNNPNTTLATNVGPAFIGNIYS